MPRRPPCRTAPPVGGNWYSKHKIGSTSLDNIILVERGSKCQYAIAFSTERQKPACRGGGERFRKMCLCRRKKRNKPCGKPGNTVRNCRITREKRKKRSTCPGAAETFSQRRGEKEKTCNLNKKPVILVRPILRYRQAKETAFRRKLPAEGEGVRPVCGGRETNSG